MNTTTIAHLRCQYLISQEHPNPADIRSCLDIVARDYLAAACSVLLTRLLDPHDTSLWFIRRLDVEMSLNVGSLDRALLAEQWGRQIVKCIMRALALMDEESRDHDALVKYFPHHNAYVAQFISDLAAGRAWEQWYYRAFDGLRNLPTSAAIRSVLSREPEQSAAILALLAMHKRLEPVLQCLTEGDARTIYELCVSVSYDVEIDEPAQHLRAEISSSRADMFPSRTEVLPMGAKEALINGEESLWGQSEAHERVEKKLSHAEMLSMSAEESLMGVDMSVLHAKMSPIDAEGRSRNDDDMLLEKYAEYERAKMSLSHAEKSLIEAEEKSRNDENSPLEKHELSERAEVLSSHTEKSLIEAEEKSRNDEEALPIFRTLEGERAEASSLLSPKPPLNVAKMLLRAGKSDESDESDELPLALKDKHREHGAYRATINEQHHIVEMLLSVWSKAGLQLSGTTVATPHNALRLYTILYGQVVRYATSNVREAIEHVLRFAEVMRRVAQPALLVSSMLRDDLTSVVELLRAAQMLAYLESLSYLQQVAAGDMTLMRRIVSTVATSTPLKPQRDRVSDRTDQRMTTLLGGLFLLLPSFIDLKLHSLLKDMSDAKVLATQEMGCVRYFIFLKCFGLLHQQWPAIARDPILSLVSGIDEAPGIETLHQLNRLVTPQMLWAWQRLLIEQLARYRSVEGRYLYAELLEIEDQHILLIKDMRDDVWLFIASVLHETDVLQATLLRGLSMVQEATGVQVACLVLGKGLGQLPRVEVLQKHWHCVWTEQGALAARTVIQIDVEEEDSLLLWEDGADSLPREMVAELLRALQQLKDADKDLRYLMLHQHRQPMLESFDFELTLSLFARAVMRSFACRLIGFRQSSIEYLYQNFLAGTSMVVVQPDLLEVQLARCPLHLVLRIAGMHEQSYTLPWHPTMQIVVALASA